MVNVSEFSNFLLKNLSINCRTLSLLYYLSSLLLLFIFAVDAKIIMVFKFIPNIHNCKTCINGNLL